MNYTDEMKVINNKEKSRFEIKLGEEYAYVEYGWRGEVFELIYIFVPVQHRGKGISEELIRYVLDDALASNRKIVVYCSWIAGYVRSHPEYHSLIQR